MRRIYYAHSMKIYNSEQEELELKQIAFIFPSCEIINPNGRIYDMKEAYKLIDKSDGVVATEYQGHIGKGVFSEICYALKKNKFVAVLRSGRLFRVYSEHQIEVLDINWQVCYAQVCEGFVIPPLKERLTVELKKAKVLHPGCGVLDDIASTTKEFLKIVGKIKLLEELLGEA